MFIGATMVIKGILLAHIESNLGEKPGIPPPKKKKTPNRFKSWNVLKEKVRLLQEIKTGRFDLILGIRKVS